MAQKSDKLAALRSAIGQQMPQRQEIHAPKTEGATTPKGLKAPHKQREVSGTRKRVSPPAEKASIPRGRGVQFYLDDEDRKYIRDLALWFASQDRRVSDSQVIKILIRAIRPSSALIEVCDIVRQSDRRREKRTKE